MDFGSASLVTDLVPRITAYTSEKLKELINLDAADRKSATPMYKVWFHCRCTFFSTSMQVCHKKTDMRNMLWSKRIIILLITKNADKSFNVCGRTA
jgi:hypothetical protein